MPEKYADVGGWSTERRPSGSMTIPAALDPAVAHGVELVHHARQFLQSGPRLVVAPRQRDSSNFDTSAGTHETRVRPGHDAAYSTLLPTDGSRSTPDSISETDIFRP
jgi:hypothetical protein